MNQMMLYSKIVTIRDAQIQEKHRDCTCESRMLQERRASFALFFAAILYTQRLIVRVVCHGPGFALNVYQGAWCKRRRRRRTRFPELLQHWKIFSPLTVSRDNVRRQKTGCNRQRQTVELAHVFRQSLNARRDKSGWGAEGGFEAEALFDRG